MLRPLVFAVAVLHAPGVMAQDLSGNIWSGFQSGMNGSFNGSIQSGFQTGLGARSPRTMAQTEDVTLGGTGAMRPGLLLGQPSNFAPSVAATAPTGGPLAFDNGPAEPLVFSNGPAGPLD